MHKDVKIGTPVMTVDDQELGQVKEIRGDYFKVDAPMAQDYWLSCDVVAADGLGGVRVSFTKAEAGDFKRPEPAAV